VSGLRYAWRFGNGKPRLLTLDTDGRLTKIDSQTVHQLTLGYDVADRLKTRTDNVDATKSDTFGYDSADRVTSASRTAGGESFAWDLVGNRTSHTGPGGSFNYTNDTASNHLTYWASTSGDRTRTFTYDSVGNLSAEQRKNGAVTSSIGYDYDVCQRRLKFDPVGHFYIGANNGQDVDATIKLLASRKIAVIVLQLSALDLTSPAGKLMLTMRAALAELVRDLLVKRTQAGLARATSKGKTLGRPSKTTAEQRAEIVAKYEAGSSARWRDNMPCRAPTSWAW
jgi:YD repeat-containing protein